MQAPRVFGHHDLPLYCRCGGPMWNQSSSSRAVTKAGYRIGASRCANSLLGVLLFTLACASQNVSSTAATSVLTGNVYAATTRAPLQGVRVTASSDALRGERVTVTDAYGLFRFAELPPGTYTLRIERENHRPYSHPAFALATAQTLRLFDVELIPCSPTAQEAAMMESPGPIHGGTGTGKLRSNGTCDGGKT